MNKTEDNIKRYLAQSKIAYRKTRSTTDMIWTNR